MSIPGNDVCLVTILLTHPGTGDNVTNWVVLPLNNWNGIFQGVGGGGYSAGFSLSLGPISASGYAAVLTDSGHTPAVTAATTADSWALVSPGNVNQYNLLNFARRSYHDMTVIGKNVTASFYGTAPKYSYWNGCSTGGRQGLVEAQFYPTDYDGILADAPAVQWNDFTPAQQWPYTVENNEGYAPLQCEFDFVNAALIEACDGLDGVTDGIISAPALCSFEATSLIGKAYTCGTDKKTFCAKAATVVDKIWSGPMTTDGKPLWFGITKGTNFSSLAPNSAYNASAPAIPFGISDSWYRGFLEKNLTFDTSKVTYAQFQDLFLQGHMEYDSTMGSASPDLREFKKAGGKMITWQGLADNYINPQGTMLYYQRVLAIDPDAADYYRQFYSPGVGHCAGGIGVQPVDAIGQLRAWVENGTAPDSLKAASAYPIGSNSSATVNGTMARFLNLCAYPAVNKYNGKGDPALAASYTCANGTGYESFSSAGFPTFNSYK